MIVTVNTVPHDELSLLCGFAAFLERDAVELFRAGSAERKWLSSCGTTFVGFSGISRLSNAAERRYSYLFRIVQQGFRSTENAFVLRNRLCFC
jgi:hypothetical protein